MRISTHSPTSGRQRSPARGPVRLVMLLSGVAIAGLALVPAASAAAATTAHARHASVVPDAPACQLWTDGESYAEAYCAPPPGQFRAWIKCTRLGETATMYGPWRYAGGGLSSYARCSDLQFYSGSGINTKSS
jgi:hypothetical protein